jgi:hypothetical protein
MIKMNKSVKSPLAKLRNALQQENGEEGNADKKRQYLLMMIKTDQTWPKALYAKALSIQYGRSPDL